MNLNQDRRKKRI